MIELKHEDRAPFITPRLRVFLSIDLIGSTDFKIRSFRQSSSEPENWAKILMHFYTDFQQKFSQNWDKWEKSYAETDIGKKEPCGPRPKLWKALGDELLFWKECWSAKEIVGVVQSWRQALIDFRTNWEHSELGFKIGAWLVGTPIRTWEVAFARGDQAATDEPYLGNPIAYNFHLLKHYYDPDDDRKIDLDFVGPSMDCGFRLLGHSTERKFILSADLAYLMLQEMGWWRRDYRDEAYPEIRFFFDGTKPLKGVTNGKIEYPVVWLDNLFGVALNEAQTFAGNLEKLVGSASRVPPESDLESFLASYLGDVKGFPDRPYICRKDGQQIQEILHKVPPEHIAKLEEFRQVYISAAEKDRLLSESFEQDGSGGEKKSNRELLEIAKAVVQEKKASI